MDKPSWAGITDGDADTWGGFLAQNIPQIYEMFIRRGWLRPFAEELVQTTVLDAVKGCRTYDPDKGSPENWIMGIARNNMALEMRKRVQQPTVGGDIQYHLEAIDSKLLPDEVLEQRETAEIVQTTLEGLDDKEQNVLKDKYIHNLSARDIAEQMGITEKAVHSLLYRARISLREGLKRIKDFGKDTS